MKMLFALLLFPAFAFAQVTYQYTGQAMNGTSPALLVTGSVVLAQPLAQNGVQVVTPVTYGFVGNLPLANQNGESYPNAPAPPSFTFTTVNGVVTAWDVEIDVTTGNSTATISITSAGDSYALDIYNAGCEAGHTVDCTPPTNASNTTPGVWSVPQAQLATYLSDAQWYLADDLLAQRDKRAALALVAQCRANKGVC